MQQNYVKLQKQPQLFVLTHLFNDHDSSSDLEYYALKFQLEFVERKETEWLKYWNDHGYDAVLERWKFLYKDYLAENAPENIEDNTDVMNLQDDENILEDVIKSSVDVIKEPVDINPKDNYNWESLWHQLTQEIYAEQQTLHSSIYNKYYLDLTKALQLKPESYNMDIVDNSEPHDMAVDESELQALGLPISFYQVHKHKRQKRTQIASQSEDEESDKNADEVEEDDFTHNEGEVRKKMTKKNRNLRKIPSFVLNDKSLLKYWRKRFSLFSRFDEGIRLDSESWFSVTPERIAVHLAKRLACDTIVDGFCGSGGNAIQFAKTCNRVIAIDIDAAKVEMAKHNAAIYNVEDNIEFIIGDFFQLCNGLKADVVFLSPPWGGPNYKKKGSYDVEKCLKPVGASTLLNAAREICENVTLYLPRNAIISQIIKLAGDGNRCEVEHNYLDTRLVAISAFYGNDIIKAE